MKLLDDSVEAIALRHDNETIALLKKRREDRNSETKKTSAETADRKKQWARQFEEEKRKAKELHSIREDGVN